uniref:GyrI-like small molecule binding domain-containing protein n=1 Tax=Grammatophora oceanica TaxID=210454 RepID=A0A7S1YM33_9STRA|mmetsp:Transcript_5739/g.8141  ORF Transcript_5739/g.8141 Transcript_5739/m.8141 type:complete len:176 (+) Transcript_5739:65-592(+)
MTTPSTPLRPEPFEQFQRRRSGAYFNPERYHKKMHRFNKRRFLKVPIASFLNIPCNVEKRIRRAKRTIAKAGASDSEELMLVEMKSSKRSNLYFSFAPHVDLPKEDTEDFNGIFVSQVFDGGFTDMSRNISVMERWIADTFGESAKLSKHEYFAHYPQKPTKDGEQRTVLFARIC